MNPRIALYNPNRSSAEFQNMGFSIPLFTLILWKYTMK